MQKTSSGDDPSTNYDETSDSCLATRRRALRRLGQMVAEALDEATGNGSLGLTSGSFLPKD